MQKTRGGPRHFLESCGVYIWVPKLSFNCKLYPPTIQIELHILLLDSESSSPSDPTPGFLQNQMSRKLSNLVSTGFYKEALSLFSNLHFQSHPIDEFTFPFLLKSCSKLNLTSHGEMLHAHVTKTGFSSDIYTATSLTAMYMKFGFLPNALKVFDEMPEPNTTLINVLVSGFSQNGRYEESFDVFRRVTGFGIRPDSVTVASLLSGCKNSVENGIQVHCFAIKIGVETDVYVATSLVTMYADGQDPVTASIVFERIRYKNVACYNAFVTGLLRNRIYGRVFEVFKEMLRLSKNRKPNSGTFVTVLSACSNLKNLKLGLQIHGYVLKVGSLLENVLVGTALLDTYSKCGSWQSGYDIFTEMSGFRSMITWNSMISGMMINGETETAIGLFMKLESDGFKPDSATWNSMISGFAGLGKPEEAFLFFRKMRDFEETSGAKPITSLLSACASIPAFSSGREIHGHSIRTRIDSDEFLATALLNMYMKCGRSSWARSVFDRFKIKPKDPVIWNAMISGYGRNGESEPAFEMFEWMKRENVKPNSSTFSGLLSVCSHAGAVEKGLEVFGSMGNYGLVPDSVHYGCVIDVLGRSGRIDEARDLLSKMPEVSRSVLDSLLGACRFHSDLKAGEEIAGLVAEMGLESSTTFAILSNIFAGEGRWKDVKELRDEMDRKRLKKIGGFSSIR